MSAETQPIAFAHDELRVVEVFADLPSDDIEALASMGDVVAFDDGEVIFRENDEAVWMVAVLEGEVHARREKGGGRTYVMRRGEVGGVLPYSRMTRVTLTGCAVGATRLFRVNRERFPDLIRAIPLLADRLVGVMSDRIREMSVLVQEQEKMAALGRLSAGFAHELNNPASAVLRSSLTLRDVLRELRDAKLAAERRALEADANRDALEAALDALGTAPVPIDPIERLALEEELAAWLDGHAVDAAWELAADLVDAGVAIDALERVERVTGGERLASLAWRLARYQRAERMLDEIELGIRRISELVEAVKQYSFMDQAPLGNVDVRDGIETTLVLLAHEMVGKRARVTTEYDERMPRIMAYGAELNQVWTNLIVNANDAISAGGSIRIRTEAHPTFVVVEIADDGVGIAPENLPRIFEPFFTTKPIGQGRGLGLDTVARVVRRHNGDVRVESVPGATSFRVTLPLVQERD